MRRAFTSTGRVAFGDVDRAGVAYYPRILHMLHRAFEDFFERALHLPYHRLLERGLGFPALAVEVRFHAPLRCGDRLRVAVRVLSVGRTSLVMGYEIRAGARRSPAVRARVATAAVRVATFRPVPIPPALRRALARLARSSPPSRRAPGQVRAAIPRNTRFASL